MTPLRLLPLALALGAAAPPPPASCRADLAPPSAAWCRTLAARPRLPLPSVADRAALAEVYARPELRRARLDPAALRGLLAGLWGRILESLGTPEAERWAGLGRAVFIAAGLVAGLAALAAARRRRRALRTPSAAPGTDLAPLPPPDRSEALAREALARGDPGAAVRHAFLAALSALERAGGVPRDRTLTNGELAARLAGGRAPAADFAALGRLFDRVVYGGLAVDLGEAREGVERAVRIGDAARGRA